MERGWRRSGKYCYKPILDKTCCPPYTIRCDAENFFLSRSQSKVIKNMNSFLKNGKRFPVSTKHSSRSTTERSSTSKEQFSDVDKELSVTSKDLMIYCDDAFSMKSQVSETSTDTLSIRTENTGVTSLTGESKSLSSSEKSDLLPSRPVSGNKSTSPSVSSRVENDNVSIGLSTSSNKSNAISIKKKKIQPVILTFNEDGLPLKAKIIRVRRRIAIESMKRNISLEAAKEVVAQEHRLKVESKNKRMEPKTLEELMNPKESSSFKHSLEVKFVSTSFTNKKDEESFYKTYLDVEHAVYEKYQNLIHNDEPDECNKKQFKRFLVDSPLIQIPFREVLVNQNNPIKSFGTYHMQYWLDRVTLIAVGVVDVLPTGLSSVYVFYDPNYSFLRLGTYTALREVLLTRQILSSFLPFKYYYMGFYIDSCVKMKYKARFQPNYLLCPETKTWQRSQDCLELLKRKKYSRLHPDDKAVDGDSKGIRDEDIGIFFANKGYTTFNVYQCLKEDDEDSIPQERRDKKTGEPKETKKSSIEEKVREYAGLVGKKAAKSMLLYLE
jgi:arginine-tRNA-protein transferase